MVDETVKVRDNGEITIPKKIREAANIESGDILKIDCKNGTLFFTHYKGK